MAVLNLTHNVQEVLGFTARFDSQYRFAVAKSLTDVARAAAAVMPAEVKRDLEEPTPFTLRGFFSTRADKAKLQAEVGVKDLQAQYLRYQIEGGQRRPKKKALRLPADVQLDSFGNMPKGLVANLIARARSGKRATKAQSAKFGVSRKVDLFYGEPNGTGQPAGIYKRVHAGTKVERLVPVVVFPQRVAKYRKRFDFYAVAERTVQREFKPILLKAWAQAKATARR